MEFRGGIGSTPQDLNSSLESRERGWKLRRVWIGRHWRKGLGQAALRVVCGWSRYLIPPSPARSPSPHLSLQCSQRFQPYVLYCLRVRQTMAYAREQQDHNPLFHIFVQVGEDSLGKGDAADLGPRQEGSLQSLTPAPLPWQWCEKHKLSGRQMLGDLLIKPHQRITKYPLLLQAVLKRTPKPQAREALTAMVGPAGLTPAGGGGCRRLVCGGAAPGTLEVSFLMRMCPCGADVVSGWDEQARSRAIFLRSLPLPLPQIAAMESFLQHINKQVRQGEEQESLVAAARRIGPYEVLEPSSEEVEKVRETEGRGLRESKVQIGRAHV